MYNVSSGKTVMPDFIFIGRLDLQELFAKRMMQHARAVLLVLPAASNLYCMHKGPGFLICSKYALQA